MSFDQTPLGFDGRVARSIGKRPDSLLPGEENFRHFSDDDGGRPNPITIVSRLDGPIRTG
ncbi:hypothetical protein RMSM_02106 [Rhodopirellula maiorica SM1]|uniref:Uncharacterized protein n=1 Tax=Rhodopirellula maiorica SM1 TaxID=1265738 RepID=M5RNU1_9BACT|nr:hypothetical protein RMSM_02106 [Rhodopirellula maiorica SM1]